MSCMYLYTIGAGNNASLNTAIMTGHGRDWVGHLTLFFAGIGSSTKGSFQSEEGVH